MKLVSFEADSANGIGAIHPDGFVVTFTGQTHPFPDTMMNLIEAGPDALSVARQCVSDARLDARLSMEQVRLLAPLPRPARLRDAFLFLEHLEAAFGKMGMKLHPSIRESPKYVNSDHTHVFGTGDDIAWPRDSDWIDYELEWACVIGKPGVRIARDHAQDHIFGYTIFNDWSARDLQIAYMETGAGPGSGKDFANSLGPCIATPDEFEDPYALAMTAHVNGELWSAGSTASMAHRFEDAVHHFSQNAGLVPGEIIGSGTVLNGCGFELDRRLAIGDVVTLTVEGIGQLTNRVVAHT